MVLNASLVAQTVKNPPAMRETSFPSLGWEDPLEEGMATHSSILAWEILMNRGAWRPTVRGVPKSRIWLSDWAQHSTWHWTERNFAARAVKWCSRGVAWQPEFEVVVSVLSAGLDIFAWEILWTEESGRLQSLGLQKLSTEQRTPTTDYIEQ